MDSMDTNADLELLAALIDGRLSGEERARAVKLLADSDEALELFANAMRDQRAQAPKVVPISTARRWLQWKVMAPIAAAAALAAVAVPRLLGPGVNGVLATQLAMELTRDPGFAGALHEGWEQRGWTVTRGVRETGTARTGSPMESKLAFRLGVRSVDLQIALQRADTALAGRLTSEILETLGAVGFSDVVLTSYTTLKSRLATQPLSRSIESASRAESELRDLLASPSFEFGEWAGAADLAAQAHDASFFESSHGTRYIRSTLLTEHLAADDAEVLRSIDARLGQGPSDRVLDEVHGILQTVIRTHGS
jgi:hypothetical protein